jgi:hypothetical protein
MKRVRLLPLFAAICGLVLAAASPASATPPPWAHGHGGGGGGGNGYSIGLIAPWGSAALTGTDSITLTYSVSASPKVSQTAITAATDAAQEWAGWLSGHDGNGHFTVEQALGGSATVPITIKPGGGTIAGQTKLSSDAQGFIDAAKVQISGSSFGLSNDYGTVYEITLHELGHAFVGLGHSDDPSDLMYPTLNGTTTIGSCEASGFDALYGWLEDGSPSTGPTLPASSSVPC